MNSRTRAKKLKGSLGIESYQRTLNWIREHGSTAVDQWVVDGQVPGQLPQYDLKLAVELGFKPKEKK